MSVKKVEPLSLEQVLALPAMPPVKAAFAALNISEGTGYGLINKGQFPIEVIPFGRTQRVRKADLCRFLGLPPVAAGVQPAAATHDDGAPGVQPGAPSEQSSPTRGSK